MYHVLPSMMVFAVLFAITVWVTVNAIDNYNRERNAIIVSQAEEFEHVILRSFNTYAAILQGGSSLFISSTDVSDAEWKRFVESFDIDNNFLGLQGIGYLEKLSSDAEVERFVRQANREVDYPVTIYPNGQRNSYTPIRFYVSKNGITGGGVGFDAASEAMRKAAIDTATETGKAALTGRLRFVSNATEVSDISGFIMYMPVYTTTTYNQDIPERKIKGFTFAPFISNDFFASIDDNDKNGLRQLRVYDSQPSDDTILYETANYEELDNSKSVHRYSSELEVFGRKWIISYRFSPDIISSAFRNRPLRTFTFGLIMSSVLSGLVFMLLLSRSRSLSAREEREIQNAKDELLSLASHQLRTPATGVKQYIGMLKEGFAGSLSEQQKILVEKAYESNERQLNIINELLYVAKIDAEGIVLSKRRVNISGLLKDIVDEQLNYFESRGQTAILDLPKKNVYAEVDEQCIRMAIENLVTNAIKYSYENTDITIGLKSGKNTVSISVTDQGIGMDEDELKLLFKRFSRIPNELSRQTSGSGIGLYLAKKLIELHGGDLEVTSTKHKGSTFTIKLLKNTVK